MMLCQHYSNHYSHGPREHCRKRNAYKSKQICADVDIVSQEIFKPSKKYYLHWKLKAKKWPSVLMKRKPIQLESLLWIMETQCEHSLILKSREQTSHTQHICVVNSTCLKISQNTKLKIYEPLTCPILSYMAKAWTMMSEEMNAPTAFKSRL